MPTTQSKRVWPEGLDSSVLLKLDLNNHDVFGILHWFFDGPTATFIHKILTSGKRWILLHKNFTYDTLSSVGESALGLGLGGVDPKEIMNLIFADKKWPVTLPESVCLSIDTNNNDFKNIINWFKINSNGEIGLRSVLAGFSYVTLCNDFTFYCHPYDTSEKVYIAADVRKAIEGKKDLVNAPVYGPVLSCLKDLFLLAGVHGKDIDATLGKYASAPKGKPGLPDFAIPVPTPKPYSQQICELLNTMPRRSRYIPVHVTHDPDSPYYNRDMD